MPSVQCPRDTGQAIYIDYVSCPAMRESYATYNECGCPTYTSSCKLGPTCAQYNEAVSQRSTNPTEKLRNLQVDEVRNLSLAQHHAER